MLTHHLPRHRSSKLAFRAPCHGICDPAVDVGFSPVGAVDVDPDLGRERALGDLAVDGGPGDGSRMAALAPAHYL